MNFEDFNIFLKICKTYKLENLGQVRAWLASYNLTARQVVELWHGLS